MLIAEKWTASGGTQPYDLSYPLFCANHPSAYLFLPSGGWTGVTVEITFCLLRKDFFRYFYTGVLSTGHFSYFIMLINCISNDLNDKRRPGDIRSSVLCGQE